MVEPGRKFNVAVVGATGAVGEAMLAILSQRGFPVGEVYAVASTESEGKRVEFGDGSLSVTSLDSFDFNRVDIAFFSAGGDVSKVFAPKAANSGSVVIDNTSAFRYDDDIPLVVAEVNPEQVGAYENRGIIANPNCSTIQMVVALKPIHDIARISRVNVATYQAVSGSGKSGITELANQTSDLLNARAIQSNVYPAQIAFNCLPHIDEFQDNGYTKEEMKMVWETKKIMECPSIEVNPTAVRVPVFFGHSEAVHIETNRKVSREEVALALQKAPGITVIDDRKDGGYPTPVEHAVENDDVFVGRIREDISHPRGISMWVVSDNIRKGAALNSVQIAEILVQSHL
tara:strand:+ start:946 stop:1977 length:1032 start_codon:yes stop_codon:yes gene_type:complete